ncbi:uncharacterized protein KD926_001968 [Aspergillus affinis]|uniref:uncharacterized protein n=1 Tax=Aspergillus affinis TaxID=1070780 RepID=UPI0022FEB9C3|nr:uncharacterized protein KD926_001968 [Aspergillus affinis]KAI9044144.1 hypothetical protein KD926_001968 [Aspergillus affinis]
MFGDGTVKYRHGIAIAQVITFSVSLAFSIWFYLRGCIGWFCIGMLSIIRLVGASCMLGTINKDADGLWAGVFVCESLGMILIIFLLLEMLERINKTHPTTPRLVFIIPQLLTWIDIGISIAGFIAVTHKEHALLPTPYSRTGIALIFAIYLWTVGVFLTFYLHRGSFATVEKKTCLCVAICVPILAVRVTYSLIFVITADMAWNAVKGDSSRYLGMTMVPELGIVALCTWTILGIPALEKEKKKKKKKKRKGGKDVEGDAGSQEIPLVR